MNYDTFYAALTRSIVRDVPPEGAYVAPAVDEQDRLQAIYDDAYFAVMEGKDCDFYPRKHGDAPEYNDEQELRLLHAKRIARSLIGVSDQVRFDYEEQALRVEAEKYAEYQRNRAAA